MFGDINRIRTLATKYSKQELASLVQNRQVSLQDAALAGMMIDRIAKSAMQPPQTTVAQDVLGAQQPPGQMPPPQMAQGQPPQMPPQEAPQMAADGGLMGMMPHSHGVAALHSGLHDMAGGGIVAFADGGDVPGYAAGTVTDSRSDPAMRIDPREQRRRDSEWRLPILLKELKEAQAKGRDEDVAAIQREIRSIKPAPSADSVITGMIPAAQAATKEQPVAAPAAPAAAPSQEERDRSDFSSGVEKLGAAAKDILTLPGRGVAGAAESVITRPLRAMGVPVPYLPDEFYGGNRESMTPYYDKIRQREAGQEAAAKTEPKVERIDTPPTGGQQFPVQDRVGPATEPSSSSGLPSWLSKSEPTTEDQWNKLAAIESPYSKSAVDAAKKLGERANQASMTREEAEKQAGKLYEGKAYEDQEKIIKDRMSKFDSEKDKALGLSLMMGGFEGMTKGSKRGGIGGILQTIGVVGKEAIQKYEPMLKDLKLAQKEDEKALAEINQARRLEKRGMYAEANRLYERSQDRSDQASEKYATFISNLDENAKNRLLNVGVQKLRTTENRALLNASAQIDFEKLDREIAGRRDIAGAQLAAKLATANKGGFTDPKLNELYNEIEMKLAPQIRDKYSNRPPAEIEQKVREGVNAAVIARVQELQDIRAKGKIPAPSSDPYPEWGGVQGM